MKRADMLLLICPLALATMAANPVSIDQFKQMDGDSRNQVLAEAPPEQKAELEKIDLHLQVLQHYGSEQAVRQAKEYEIAAAKGFGGLQSVFSEYHNLWHFYSMGIVHANERTGMKLDRRAVVEQRLLDEETIHVDRFKEIYPLVASLAVSPQASALEKKAEMLRTQFRRRYGQEGPKSPPPVTREELVEAEKQLVKIVEELKRLPRLSPEQVEHEIDGFPDKQLHQGGATL